MMLSLLLAAINFLYVSPSFTTTNATHFTAVQAALDAVPVKSSDTTVVKLAPGTYREKVSLKGNRNHVRLIGDAKHPEKVVISWNDSNAIRHYPGTTNEIALADAASSNAFYKVSLVTFEVKSDDFEAEGVTFCNTAWQEYWDGLHGAPGQALALKTNSFGSPSTFRRCRFISGQDTVCVYGPTYFEDCFIEGTTDFIYGKRLALLNRCVIHARGVWITADGHGEANPAYMGYLFYQCRIIVEKGKRTYLGRPWRKGASVWFADCSMTTGVRPEMWSQWNGETRGLAQERDYGTRSPVAFNPPNGPGQWGEGIIIRGTLKDFWRTIKADKGWTTIGEMFSQEGTEEQKAWRPKIRPAPDSPARE